MDQRRVSNVIQVLRYLADGLSAEGSGYAHVPSELALVLSAPGPGDGCKRCGGPIGPYGGGRRRLNCEKCRPPRRKADTKLSPKSTVSVEANSKE